MNEKRIAGPYDPLYADVTRMLRDSVNSLLARWIYFAMLSFFYVEEEWGDDPVWAYGIVRAAKTDIAKQAGIRRGSFYRAWQQLVDAGLVREQEDGTFLLPYYKKKGYDSISAREIKERQQRSDKNQEEANTRLSRLEELHEGDLDDRESQKSADYAQNEAKVSRQEAKRPHEEAKRPHDETAASLLMHLNKASLSGNNIISGFYKGIGQKRISRVKRERGLKVLRKLRKDKFDLKDIAFAVEWILENAKEELYDFSIVEHTIGQAIAARDKQESERKEAEEREKAAQKERSKRDAEVQEREEIEAYKANLSADARAALRKQAEAEISAAGIYKPGFLSEPLIAVKENEILRKERKK